MLRIAFRLFGLTALVLFFAACGCDDDERTPKDDGGIPKDDEGTPKDDGGSDSACPLEPPKSETACSSDLLCTYEPFDGCHGDGLIQCPAECGGDIYYSVPCNPFGFKCENSRWRQVSTSSTVSKSTRRPVCRCPFDSGYMDSSSGDGSHGKVDSATNDAAGSDDDAGN